MIFLLHSYFQAGARLLVEHIAGPALSLQLVIPTLAGIVGPVMIWMVAERAGLQWMFRLRPIKARDTVYRPDPQTVTLSNGSAASRSRMSIRKNHWL